MPLSTAPAESHQRLARLLDRPAAIVSLATLDTPVQRMPGLDVGRQRVWVKRDEHSCPTYGGGKVRKLEYVLGDPHYRDEHILGIGALGSHQLVALALLFARSGGRLSALCFDQVLTPAVEQNLATTVSLIARSGGRITHAKTRLGLGHAWLRDRSRPDRGRYLTPGASNAIGCFGFVVAGFELAAQVRAGLLPQPTTIYIATGTAGSAAGLAIGLALCDLSTQICLVSAVERWAFNGLIFRAKLREVYAELRARGLEGPQRVTRLLESAQVTYRISRLGVGRSYGVPTQAANEAQSQAAVNGLVLETTYTAKCLAAMRAELLASSQGPCDHLFWNTHADSDLRPYINPNWRSLIGFELPPPPRETSTRA